MGKSKAELNEFQEQPKWSDFEEDITPVKVERLIKILSSVQKRKRERNKKQNGEQLTFKPEPVRKEVSYSELIDMVKELMQSNKQLLKIVQKMFGILHNINVDVSMLKSQLPKKNINFSLISKTQLDGTYSTKQRDIS